MSKSKVANSQRVGKLEKFGFLIMNIGNIPLMTLLSTYFLIFYTDVVGLSAGAIATLFLVSKIVDGISDPLMGFLLDRFPVTKYGKFRPLLVIGTIICVINYILLWFGAVWSPVAKYVIVYATYLLLGITFDIMDISLNSLLPTMTTDNSERNSLSSIKAIGYTAGTIAISILGPVIVASGTLESYYVLIFGFMVVVLVGSIVGVLFVHERAEFHEDKAESYSVKELLHFLVTRPVLVTFATNLIYQALTGCASGSNTYFFTYIIGNLALLSVATIVGTIAIIPGIILSPILANRIGKKKTYVIGLLFFGAGMGVRLFAPTSMTLVYVGTAVTYLGSGLAMTLQYGIQADNTTYVQYTTGKHAEAAIASLSSFITKCAQGIAGALPGYILAWTGYVANAEVQTSMATSGIIVAAIVIPFIGAIAAAIVFGVFYPLDKKKIDEMAEANNAKA